MQGSKTKKWAEALDRALHRESAGKGSPKWLDVLANRLVEAASEGDVSALKEVGDRIDGKPKTVIAGDEDSPLEMKLQVSTKIVDAD